MSSLASGKYGRLWKFDDVSKNMNLNESEEFYRRLFKLPPYNVQTKSQSPESRDAPPGHGSSKLPPVHNTTSWPEKAGAPAPFPITQLPREIIHEILNI
jgi:hypothetical protein